MSRRANKKDANQPQIERQLKQLGIQFIDTSMRKKDTFDMLVLSRGNVWLVEVKNPATFPKYFFNLPAYEKDEYLIGTLTDEEKATMRKCELAQVPFVITYSTDHLLRVIGALPRPFQNNAPVSRKTPIRGSEQ